MNLKPMLSLAAVCMVTFVGLSSASARRIYSLNHPAVTKVDAGKCEADGQSGKIVATPSTVNMPGGVGCAIGKTVIVVNSNTDQDAVDDFMSREGVTCIDADDQTVICELPEEEEGECPQDSLDQDAEPQEPGERSQAY